MGPRSTSRSISRDDALVVAQIRGPHGIRGDVRVDPRTDVAGRFTRGAVFECDGVGPLRIASVRGEAASPIVRFAGYDTRDAAATLRDRFLRVPRDESRRAAKGAYLWADLVGLAALNVDGRALGTVRDLIRAGGTDILVVVDDAGRETLHPMLESVVREIDIAADRVVLSPLEE
ncbi:MAG TPA: ribosome maturation factor RimM [Candidatus Limnocylindria bacterium]|nr:ribosome maturation factor RimM [Candidatus Limnocylindria bacterium]